jgi:hypothetical protein
MQNWSGTFAARQVRLVTGSKIQVGGVYKQNHTAGTG